MSRIWTGFSALNIGVPKLSHSTVPSTETSSSNQESKNRLKSPFCFHYEKSGLGLLGRIHLHRNDPARAKAVFLQALTSKPENPSLLAWLGQAHLMLGNQGQARKNLELALQINPELALARRLLGEAPTPPAEREAVAQTPSRPSKHVSGAAIAKGNAWPKQWSAKPAVTAPIVPLPSHTIKQSAAPEPDHPLDHPTSLPEPTLPYSLPPALRKVPPGVDTKSAREWEIRAYRRARGASSLRTGLMTKST